MVLNSRDHILKGHWLVYENYPEWGDQVGYKANPRIKEKIHIP